MKTKIRKISAVFLFLILCLTVFPASAYAATETAVVKIPVSVELSGKTPEKDETYTVTISAVDKAPMPETDRVTITGSGKVTFGEIVYTIPGVYCYQIRQQPGSHERGHYDGSVYYVKVTVTNAEEGGLETSVAAHMDSEMTEAKREIVFRNSYDAVQKPSEPGDHVRPSGPADQTRPSGPADYVKTGDSSSLSLYGVLLVCSGVAAGMLKKYGRKKCK